MKKKVLVEDRMAHRVVVEDPGEVHRWVGATADAGERQHVADLKRRLAPHYDRLFTRQCCVGPSIFHPSVLRRFFFFLSTSKLIVTRFGIPFEHLT